MKKISILISLLLLFSLLASCGGADQPATEPLITDGATESAAAESAETEYLPETELESEGVTEEAYVPVNDAAKLERLPENSSELSYDTALALLSLCSGGTEENTKTLMRSSGFEPVITKNYDKKADDPSHTSAFAVGEGSVMRGDEKIAATLIVIRGTSGGEWYSNFDFAPSQNNDTEFAESFLFAAQDVFRTVKDMINGGVVVICGHSRGAAVANLLGVLLNSVYDSGNIYVYTFATPNTVRGETAMIEQKNIFNFINTSDIVTYLPLSSHGYSRAGTDIILTSSPDRSAEIQKTMDSLYGIAPDIVSYYTDRHSLTSSGPSEDGVTVFEFFSSVIGSAMLNYGKTDGISANVSSQSDLYPLYLMLNNLTVSSDASNNPLTEHMPARYQALILQIS